MKLTYRDGAGLARRKLKINRGDGSFLLIAYLAVIADPFFWSWSGLMSAIILYWYLPAEVRS
jgi:hypothetical protein